ncbi:uncharacterized protein DFL_007352 [Arthrobotrys flagrans]|uniref:Uncharacterized protein n=1 Tax=Arthrobotrys flagrans TaxID=97331 RepID=A0A436ZVF2_ARTFL|nr:hypothetical protein DFL_007352 [Arthrobotrys flagrans]
MAQEPVVKPAPGYDAESYSSEEESSRHSSIFQASLYFVEVEDGKQPAFVSGSDHHLVSGQARDETGTLSTSVDSCATLVPKALDTVTVDYMSSDTVDLDLDLDDPKVEPLRVYTSPMEPTERPPAMPVPPAKRRAEALAEILFRQAAVYENTILNNAEKVRVLVPADRMARQAQRS